MPLCCGIGRRITALSPPQNRTHPFPSMRLPGQESLALSWQSRVAPRWVCLQPQGPYLTYAIVPLCSPFLSPDPLSHVSPLSGWVSPLTRPDPAGYGFPVPFGCWPSLLGTSSPPGVLVFPHGRPTDIQGTRPIFHCQTPKGLSRSASIECSRGGRSLYAGAWCPRREASRTLCHGPIHRLCQPSSGE